MTLPFHAAAVLDHFWKQFSDEMDANAIVGELVHEHIIPESIEVEILRASSPKRQNEILHVGLKTSCTKEALMKACDIIIAVEGNSRMAALGADMKRCLETGKCTLRLLILTRTSLNKFR